jgi:hypothetical protein
MTAPLPPKGAGGTCVIRGCVPKKLLVYASSFRDEFDDAGECALKDWLPWKTTAAAVSGLQLGSASAMATGSGTAAEESAAVVELPSRRPRQPSQQQVSSTGHRVTFCVRTSRPLRPSTPHSRLWLAGLPPGPRVAQAHRVQGASRADSYLVWRILTGYAAVTPPHTPTHTQSSPSAHTLIRPHPSP